MLCLSSFLRPVSVGGLALWMLALLGAPAGAVPQ